MVVKVYGSADSGCSQRVFACFLEKGIEFEIVHVDLQAGDHKQPDFMSLHPFGQIPVIEEGEFRLFESRAILRYYATKYASHGPDLLGSTPEERATVDQWIEVEGQNFNESVHNLVMQLMVLPRIGEHRVDLVLVHRCVEKLERVLDVYEAKLGKSKYLAGESFSIADLVHLPSITFLVGEGKLGHLIATRKNVKAWWDDISTRPSWKKVMTMAGF